MAHAIQPLTDLHIRATVFSIVVDMTSTAAMLHGLHQGGANDTALPFVVQCTLNHLCTSGSTTSTTPMWIHQREGSEQMEEALMPVVRSRATWTFALSSMPHA